MSALDPVPPAEGQKIVYVGRTWADVVGVLPAQFLTWAAALGCLAFACLLMATIDSTYRTHKPFKVAGYLFGYGADEPSEVDKLRDAVNEQLVKLRTGMERDSEAVITNSSSANGAGSQFDKQGGKCPDGESLVGLQPMSSREGSSIRYQCGRLPNLHIAK